MHDVAFLGLLLAFVVLLIFGQNRGPADHLGWRLARLERKVDLILAKLDITYEDKLEDRVAELVGQGRKIDAIEQFREAAGASLREAKSAVENIASGRPTK
jgi:hypothetical protein